MPAWLVLARPGELRINEKGAIHNVEQPMGSHAAGKNLPWIRFAGLLPRGRARRIWAISNAIPGQQGRNGGHACGLRESASFQRNALRGEFGGDSLQATLRHRYV